MRETTEASTHRKLIRPSLTEVREQQKRYQEEQQRLAEQRMQERRQQQQRQNEQRPNEQRPNEHRSQEHRGQDQRRGDNRAQEKRRPEGRPPEKRPQPEAKPKRSVPPDQTNAENFYYVKQMQNRTPIAVVLRDGEELRGYIEWYDRHSIKLNRSGEPNVMVYKANIKYIFKLNDKPLAAEGDGAARLAAEDAPAVEAEKEGESESKAAAADAGE